MCKDTFQDTVDSSNWLVIDVAPSTEIDSKTEEHEIEPNIRAVRKTLQETLTKWTQYTGRV